MPCILNSMTQKVSKSMLCNPNWSPRKSLLLAILLAGNSRHYPFGQVHLVGLLLKRNNSISKTMLRCSDLQSALHKMPPFFILIGIIGSRPMAPSVLDNVAMDLNELHHTFMQEPTSTPQVWSTPCGACSFPSVQPIVSPCAVVMSRTPMHMPPVLASPPLCIGTRPESNGGLPKLANESARMKSHKFFVRFKDILKLATPGNISSPVFYIHSAIVTLRTKRTFTR